MSVRSIRMVVELSTRYFPTAIHKQKSGICSHFSKSYVTKPDEIENLLSGLANGFWTVVGVNTLRGDMANSNVAVMGVVS